MDGKFFMSIFVGIIVNLQIENPKMCADLLHYTASETHESRIRQDEKCLK